MLRQTWCGQVRSDLVDTALVDNVAGAALVGPRLVWGLIGWLPVGQVLAADAAGELVVWQLLSDGFLSVTD